MARRRLQTLSSRPTGGAPTGKGIFVRTIAGVGGVDAIISKAQSANLEWLCVQVWWQEHDRNLNDELLPELATKLGEAGIALWFWAWPLPSQRVAFLSALSAAGTAIHWRGLILDIEGAEWFDQYTATAQLMAGSRQVLGHRALGVSSYGFPSNFPTMPWAELAAASDFGVPQVYKGSEVYGPTYEAQGVAQWQELGFKAIVPALAAYDFSPQLMSQVYRRTPQPQGAVIWWDAYNADNNPGAWQSIRMAGEMGLAAAPYGHGRSLRGSRRRR